MSGYRGYGLCPDCKSSNFRINSWTTYFSVICMNCERKVGELSHALDCNGVMLIIRPGEPGE